MPSIKPAESLDVHGCVPFRDGNGNAVVGRVGLGFTMGRWDDGNGLARDALEHPVQCQPQGIRAPLAVEILKDLFVEATLGGKLAA